MGNICVDASRISQQFLNLAMLGQWETIINGNKCLKIARMDTKQ